MPQGQVASFSCFRPVPPCYLAVVPHGRADYGGASLRGGLGHYRGLQASRIRAKTLTAMPRMQQTITTQVAVLLLTSEQAPKSTEL